MKRFSSGSGLNTLVHTLITCFLLTGLHSWADAASTLSLQQSAHFVESDGSDVLVEAGTYEVETLVGSRLKLNTPGGTTLFLDAQATTHSEEIEAPLAVTVVGEDPDVVHIVLVLPNGQALDAPGSLSGTRSRGFSAMLASTAQIQFAVAQKGPVVRDHRTPPTLFSRIEYRGNYPSHRSPGWSSELQGLAHDNQNWFITQKSRLWKFPLTHDLNRQLSGPDPAKGILAVGIPDSLKRVGYNHFGDLDQNGGFLFIPLEGSQTPRIAVFRAHDLSFVGSFILSGQKKAGWCA
ncbi:MAG: hypothetical protein OEV70_11830, partial [Nitrospirota bacterium]|nr:hypothetical protein [Nitrospirota bacterium]